MAITYPSDWKQKTGERYVSAVSADGHAWSGLATLEGVKDKQAGITRIKQEFEKYLQDIKFDDTAETKGGSQIVTGIGKAKKAGVDVVFAAGVFDTASGQLAGIAFVADKNLDDYYKQAAAHLSDNSYRGELGTVRAQCCGEWCRYHSSSPHTINVTDNRKYHRELGFVSKLETRWKN